MHFLAVFNVSLPGCIRSLEHSDLKFNVYLFSNSTPGQWSSTDVTTTELGNRNVLCSATHLTSFAVLVAVEDAAVTTLFSIWYLIL